MENIRYNCPKCNNRTYDRGEMRATSGFWTKIFNIQNRKFNTISCSKCGYTEFYDQRKSSTGENILDFLTN